jgi:hypothetical protein
MLHTILIVSWCERRTSKFGSLRAGIGSKKPSSRKKDVFPSYLTKGISYEFKSFDNYQP